MKIELSRKPGYFGRSAPLNVLVDGRQVATVEAGKTVSFFVDSPGAKLQVSMQESVSSPTVLLPTRHTDETLKFECGTPVWLLFDIFGICLLPRFRQRVFFLKATA